MVMRKGSFKCLFQQHLENSCVYTLVYSCILEHISSIIYPFVYPMILHLTFSIMAVLPVQTKIYVSPVGRNGT